MAALAIGRRPVVALRGGRPKRAAADSWAVRQWALWSRMLSPLRPLDAPRGRATDWDASWPLAQEPVSVRRARRLVTAQLAEWAVADLADTAELLVSELVTNALRHTRGPLRLNLRLRDSRLMCEVEDTESAGPVRNVVGPDAEGGRGTELLDVLAGAWGTERTATGKSVWFELHCEDGSAGAAGPAR
ncbi:ATP-binding protein [Streptomyces sp. 2231.1]|uniref:ATP-binding protein n=1 Tax=unclassified Streptomyces TaxID=2593676 RepID=UPI0008997FC8|nr:ATP-binding protein [Streptomyces sp. 2231.1]SEC99598.1 Anti-sigma regulatory factor (Ser/Thr protein kinase) [Streptomyces sp. 2231.1]